jgi:hypothetical protein
MGMLTGVNIDSIIGMSRGFHVDSIMGMTRGVYVVVIIGMDRDVPLARNVKLKICVYVASIIVNSLFYQTTRRYNPEDSHLRTHRRENLKSYLVL